MLEKEKAGSANCHQALRNLLSPAERIAHGQRTEPALDQPIPAFDMYEHAYHIDYGAKAAAYVDAYMQLINRANVRWLLDECDQWDAAA